jgi:hypothetical protein
VFGIAQDKLQTQSVLDEEREKHRRRCAHPSPNVLTGSWGAGASGYYGLTAQVAQIDRRAGAAAGLGAPDRGLGWLAAPPGGWQPSQGVCSHMALVWASRRRPSPAHPPTHPLHPPSCQPPAAPGVQGGAIRDRLCQAGERQA